MIKDIILSVILIGLLASIGVAYKDYKDYDDSRKWADLFDKKN